MGQQKDGDAEASNNERSTDSEGEFQKPDTTAHQLSSKPTKNKAEKLDEHM
jgi:hypothetical protein